MGGWPQGVSEGGGDHLTTSEREADCAQQCGRKSRQEKPRPFLKAHGLQLAITSEGLLPSPYQQGRRRKLPVLRGGLGMPVPERGKEGADRRHRRPPAKPSSPQGMKDQTGARFWCHAHRYVCAKGRDGNGTNVWRETGTGMWVWAEAGQELGCPVLAWDVTKLSWGPSSIWGVAFLHLSASLLDPGQASIHMPASYSYFWTF